MKISLLTLGTRGDVQPFAVLGRALKQRGHEVTLSTGKNFQPLADDYGIGFTPVEADFQTLINSAEGKAMMRNPFLARKHFNSIVHPMMVDAMKRFYEIAGSSDRVLFHVKSLADYFADRFPEKMIRANVIPAVQPTSEFPNPVFSGLSLPGFLNSFTYKLADMGLAMMNRAIKQFRKTSSLGAGIPRKINLTSLYGISGHFLPKPPDYPSNTYFTGFWVSGSPTELSADIVDFLDTELPKVVITFGSMPFSSKIDFKSTLDSLSLELNVKFLIVKGWGFDDDSIIESDRIRVIKNAPFDKLFPKIQAVIHHGGIGTLVECLRAGVPSVSCPVIYPMGDQHFWGMRAFKIGCALKPIPLKQLEKSKLTQAITNLLASGDMRSNCQTLAMKLNAENGLNNACDLIENHK